MHEEPQRGLIPVCSVYIYNIRFILEFLSRLFHHSVDMVNRKSVPHHIPLRDEDHISLGEIFKFIARFRHISIDQAAVIPRPFGSGTPIRSLYLNIILLSHMIGSINIKND